MRGRRIAERGVRRRCAHLPPAVAASPRCCVMRTRRGRSARQALEGDAAVRPCPLGCPEVGTAIGSLATTMAISLSRSHYTLTRCGCGRLLYLSPAPTASDLHAMYVDERQFGVEYTDPE